MTEQELQKLDTVLQRAQEWIFAIFMCAHSNHQPVTIAEVHERRRGLVREIGREVEGRDADA